MSLSFNYGEKIEKEKVCWANSVDIFYFILQICFKSVNYIEHFAMFFPDAGENSCRSSYKLSVKVFRSK